MRGPVGRVRLVSLVLSSEPDVHLVLRRICWMNV